MLAFHSIYVHVAYFHFMPNIVDLLYLVFRNALTLTIDPVVSRKTKSSAVAERPRDASCLSVVNFKFQHTYSAVFYYHVTAASDLY